MSTQRPPSWACSRWSPAARFSPVQTERLVSAIAVHDEIDLSATLPGSITLHYEVDLLERCYWISYRLWEDVERPTFVGLAYRLATTGQFCEADAQLFKDIRARAKQLRFAYAVLGARHRYPLVLDRFTRLMGQAQDAARSGRRAAAAARGALLRSMSGRFVSMAILRETRGFRVTSASGFRDHVLTEIESVRLNLAQPAITNKVFHDTRKVVSRMVALYDTLKVLAPSDHHRAVARYLGTINGLMGAVHDEMTVRRIANPRDYLLVPEPLPATISERLTKLTSAFAPPRPVDRPDRHTAPT